MTGTPTFLLNGVYIGADSSWALSDWQSVIDPIVNATASRARVSSQQQPTPSTTTTTTRGRASTTNSEPVAAVSALLSKLLHRVAANETCPSTQTVCDYEPKKYECCTKGENCIPNVGCRCLSATGRC